MVITTQKRNLINNLIPQLIESEGLKNKAKGERIFIHNSIRLNTVNWQTCEATFAVQSESDQNRFYGVKLKAFDTDDLQSSCTCPYSFEGICKHEIAAMFFLLEKISELPKATDGVYEYINHDFENLLIEKQTALQTAIKEKVKSANSNIIQLPSLDARSLLNYTTWGEYALAQQIFNNGSVTEDNIGNNKGSFKVTHKLKEYTVTVEKLENNDVMLQCNCFDHSKKLCIHKTATLYYLNVRFGVHGLNFLKSLDDEKEKLLNQYGYSLKDNIKNKFDFYFDGKGLQLSTLDVSLQKIPGTEEFANWTKKFLGTGVSVEDKITEMDKSIGDEELIFVFVQNLADKFPDATFKVLVGKRKKNGEFYKSISLYDSYTDIDAVLTDENDERIIEIARLLNSKVLLAPFMSNSWSTEDSVMRNYLKDADYKNLQLKISAGFEEIFKQGEHKNFYLGNIVFRDTGVDPDFKMVFGLSKQRLAVSLILDEDDEHLILKPVFIVDGKTIDTSKFLNFSSWIWIKGDLLYKINAFEDLMLLEKFNSTNELKFRTKDFETLFNTMIKPLSKKNKVVVLKHEQQTIEGLKPNVNLYLKEYDKFLLLVPQFEYGAHDVKETGDLYTTNDLLFTRDNIVYTIKRDLAIEAEYTAFFKSLHPDFERNMHQEFFHIPFDKIMERGWFFDLFEKLKAKEITVFGQNELRKIKYNYNRPMLKFGNSSGIDWLEIKTQVSFGDTSVSLNEIRKAIINKQFFVPLSDGTIGLLPEDWVARYAPMFRIGQVDDDTLRLSKLHFTLIDELSSEIDNESLLRELHEKKTKLMAFKSLTPLPVPKNINAKLRHYQHEGFQWLNFLDEFAWGGCLADDMGLGKTLQVLTFLQHLKNEKRLETCLVVVPTTLIFNWNNEIEKYSNQLKVLTHRGVEREVNHDEFGKYDIVLTTYGTLRSDIADFKEFNFHYIILDESQAIKNPTSQISKAVRLLKAKNRLVMTGTPIENNTFDLYSQLEFLNPGFLGSQEFFRTEFAIAIDKYADESKAKELRKIIAPFVLKRTKEEVAKDLPEKTETILYCEMDKPQRKVYEAFKNKYRDAIMNKIDSEGLNKSGFLILEGLLKLRMICDSPVLVGDADNDFGNDSAKLNELIREISENAGHHKILVFSQFLKMLDLIKQKLEELQIPYEYLDGQTINRKERVDTFQNDDTVRVFLISLKAGGVGINLTEADYVYLVDPWWNPAVERQAIDRTHRIGQKKNVFAYKMICKDTIEEKIIQLQEKKKTLASNLIDTEKNILKKLNKEDIAMLFR